MNRNTITIDIKEIMALYKLIMRAKFSNLEEFQEFKFSTIISDLIIKIKSNIPELPKVMKIEERPKTYELIKKSIEGIPNWKNIAEDEKKILVNILIAPFDIDPDNLEALISS